MKKRMQQILDRLHQYSSANMAESCFGLDRNILYDALVVAPSYSPPKLLKDGSFRFTLLRSGSHCDGYLVEKDGLTIAWITTASGACNLLDYLLICGELQCKQLIFLGAVGALKADFEVGEICTPTYSIAGTLANTYLKDSLRDYIPFEAVYPDPTYLAQVLALARDCGHPIFGTDLIEMETATFYAVAALMELPAVALLVVSDNSATGAPLVGRADQAQRRYEHARTVVLPALLEALLRKQAPG